MNTPVYDFCSAYQKKEQNIRLHMPGHKGVNGPLGIEGLDITEISGADNLWQAAGIIQESEHNASRLFGCPTFYSTEGSSLCIRAMLFLVKKYALKCHRAPVLLCGRNAHKTLMTAAALLDVDIRWLWPQADDPRESCSIHPRDVEAALQTDAAPVALYITSPDYLGNTADIQALAELCHKKGMLLLVDNAHGAYLKFLSPSRHPMDLGADLCCDSAHKTLPVLTGGAYLHIADKADPFFRQNAKAALSVFATTSPSYLILCSLDLCNRFLQEAVAQRCFDSTARRLDEVKDRLLKSGMELLGDEPMKLTLRADGLRLSGALHACSVMEEYAGEEALVLMFSPQNTPAEFTRTEKALLELW